MTKLIQIDGSEGEGGGQILRSSVALSILTGKPFEIVKIRAKRSQPGLRPQHCESILSAAKISGAAVSNVKPGSTHITFAPKEVRAGSHEFSIGTAGSTTLVLHTVYLPLALTKTPSEVCVTGGTHNPHAPSAHYLRESWAPAMHKFGIDIETSADKYGFYPRGGGNLSAKIHSPRDLHGWSWLSRGELQSIQIVSMVTGLPRAIAERQAVQAEKRLRSADLKKQVRESQIEVREQSGQGTMLGIRCRFETGSAFFAALGERGKRAEQVADEAADDLIAFLKTKDAPVDPHLADQVLLPASFANSPTEFRTSEVTQHLLTNAEVIAKFVDAKITIAGELGESANVRIEPDWNFLARTEIGSGHS